MAKPLDPFTAEAIRSQVARIKGTAVKWLSHDVQEATLCLDREEPNIKMALARLRSMKKILDDFGSEA